MNVAHPLRGIIPTLDAPVIEALAATTKPLTGREVNRLAGVGSPRGVQLVLRRLVVQGLVLSDGRDNAGYYLANRDHLAWRALESLARLRLALRDRLSEEITTWALQPLHASMFGSAARGDGDSASDIDLLLIRPNAIEPIERWDQQVDRLREDVPKWTGNHCQAFDIGLARLAEHVAAHDPLLDAWLADGLHLAGSGLRGLIASLPHDAQPQ
jgi:predicted nucleotidyltransferase